MRMYDIILKKREGGELTTEEINFFITGYTNGEIPDYQASALLMAIFLKGMNERETVDLTKGMMYSGDTVDLSAIHGVKVDKHSTGGVGDTTTLVLAPLVAACGVPVAKMSGRGLGHTGGTLDKLEAIPGFSIEVEIDDFINNVNTHGVAVIGQTADIAPADKKLYALRDVTATVDNISLIAGSIMSKKLAAGSDAIVLDVKVGSGAFMKDFESASALAKEMVTIGNGMKRNTIAVITNMEQPLGYAVGNALEVQEAIDTLNGQGPSDLTELCLFLASKMVFLGKGADSIEAARKLVESKIASGEAFAKYKEFIKSQGGDPEATLPKATLTKNFVASRDGYITAIQSDEVGIAAMVLGAGRLRKEDPIDMAAGIMLKKKVGDMVKKGDIIAELFTNDESKFDDAVSRMTKAYTIGDNEVAEPALIRGAVIDGKLEVY